MKAAPWRSTWLPGGTAVPPQRIVLAELLLLALVLAVFVWFAVQVFGGPFLPSSAINDGFGYFSGAKSFYFNHTLRGPVLHLDNVSLIGELYSHGFAYSLINGGVALIVGWHDRLIVAINVALLAMATLFILTRRDAWPWKLAFLLIFLTYFLVPAMTFAFMQEILHLLLALVLGHLLLAIVARDETERSWGLIVGYLVLIVLAALPRPSWVFWAAGLLAIARSRREIAGFGLLALAFAGLGQLFIKLFYAPYPYYSPHTQTVAALMDFRLLDAAHAYFAYLSDNLSKLFAGNLYIFGHTHIPNAYTLLVAALTVYLFARYHRHGDRLALAVALVATPYILSFIFLYDSLSAARHLGIIFVLQLTYLVMSRNVAMISALALAQLALFPAVVGITDRVIGLQASAGDYAVQHREQLQKIDDLGAAIRIGRRATIYLDNALTNGQYPVNVHLPLRSGDGHPLRYSLDLIAIQPMSERKFGRNFLDFVLSAQPLNRSDLALAYQADNLYLYRLGNKP